MYNMRPNKIINVKMCVGKQDILVPTFRFLCFIPSVSFPRFDPNVISVPRRPSPLAFRSVAVVFRKSYIVNKKKF